MGEPPPTGFSIKDQKSRFLTEGRKAVTYYSVRNTKRPASEVHRGPVVPTVPDSWRVPHHPSKSKNPRFPTEGRKAVICYSVDSTRRPGFPKSTEAQHFPPCLPT
jgi:hypothetical protein